MENEIVELVNQGILKWDSGFFFLTEAEDIIKSYKCEITVQSNENELIKMKETINVFGYDCDDVQLEVEENKIIYVHVRFLQKKEFDQFVLALFNTRKAEIAFFEDKVGPIAIFRYHKIRIQIGPEKYCVNYFFEI